MSIRAILFDIDDTLIVETPVVEASFIAACEGARLSGVDSRALAASVRANAERLWQEAPETAWCRAIGMSSWEALWAEFDGQSPEERLLRAWAPGWRREAWARALGEVGGRDVESHGSDGGIVERLSDAFRRERRARNALFPEVREVLEDLRRSHRLGIVSNGVGGHQRGKIEATGIAGLFDVASFSGDAGVGKPDPRVFAAALERLGVTPPEAAMVGNSLRRDMGGALAAGIRAIWVNRGGAPREGTIVPDAEIADLREVRRALG